MKKTLFFILMMVCARLSFAQTVNPLMVGMKLTERGIHGYMFYLEHYVESTDETHSMTGTMDMQCWVTSLRVDDVDILEPGQKLPGVPLPLSGFMKNVNMSIYALDGNDRFIARGWASYDILTVGQQIEVLLRLDDQAKYIQFERSGQQGDVVFIDGNHAGHYDIYRGYIIWTDISASFGPHEYQIYDVEGNPVEIGQLDMHFNLIEAPSPTEYTGMSLPIEGGVVYLTSDSVRPQTDYTIDGQIAMPNGETASAKVFVVDPGAVGGTIWVGGGYTDATFYVVEGDTLYEIDRLVPEENNTWRWHSVAPSGRRVMVVVRGEAGTSFNFSAGFNGKGGGKGKPARR